MKGTNITEILEIRNGLAYSVVDGVEAGLKSGLYKEYAENGNLAYVANYKDGLLDGDAFYYDNNGRKSIKENYKNGQLEKRAEFDKYGFLKFGMEIIDANKKICYYCMRGEPILSGMMENDLKEGRWAESQLDGSVCFKNYKHGILNGSYKLIRFDNVLEKGYYKDGKLDRIRQVFNPEDGTKVEIKYQKGKIVSEKFYDSEGRLTYSIDY